VLAGRDALLARLDALLRAGDGLAPRTVALCGLGGAGKTSVAVGYAYRHLAEVGVAWQLAAEDATVLAAGFAELAAQLGVRGLADVRDPVASVHAVLAGFPAPWLLLFDNAADMVSVAVFLPPAGPGRVLITSQNPHWPGTVVDVPVLDPDAAAGFLISRTGDPGRTEARDLADMLGGLPLALEQAAAYIKATGMTLAGYLSVFRDRAADLLARGQAAGHPASVAATLELALSRLGDEAPAAAGLLQLLACLAPEPVPLALLLSDAQAAGELDPGVADMVGSLLGDLVAAGDAIAALRRYSLVTPAGDGLVMVHRLVQAAALARVSADVAGQWKQAAAALVQAAVPADTAVPAAWRLCAVLLPHARAVLGLTSGGTWRIAQYLGYSGSYPAARDLFQLIADAHRNDEAYGPEHPDTLAARASLAHWTGQAGDPAAARDQFTVLLPVRERVLGPEHPDTLTARASLARWTGEAGDPAAARDQFAALLPVEERVIGPEHPDTLSARGHLAGWTGRAGDPAGARDQYAALLAVEERVLGPEHRETLGARANLAFWSGRAGDPAGARDQYAALLPVDERVLGPEHPHTLTARHELAALTGLAGDPAAARDLFAALLPVRERVLGSEHPDTLAVRTNLARWTGQAKRDPGAGVK
jgi:Tetratricopeptide repeat